MSKSSLQKLLSRVSKHLLLSSMSVGAMLGAGTESQVHGQDNTSQFNATQFNQAFQGNAGFKPSGNSGTVVNQNQFGGTFAPETRNAPKTPTNAFSPSGFSPKSKVPNTGANISTDTNNGANSVANIRPTRSVNPGQNTFQAYPLTNGNAEEISKQLKAKLGNLVEVVTDRASNRLLVNCTIENHRLVEQVIKGFETTPTSTSKVSISKEIKSIRSFNVSTDIIRDAANKLSQLYVDKDRIIVAADEIVGKLMIFATETDYEDVATYLKEHGFLTSPKQTKEVAAPGTKQHQLQSIGWRALEAAVIQAWGTEVRIETSTDGAFSRIQLPSYKNNSSMIQVDRRNNAVQVQSSGRQLDGIMKLLSVLDQEHGKERVELIKSSAAAVDQVQSTVSMYKFASLQQEANPQSTSAIIGKRAPKNGVYAIYQDSVPNTTDGNPQENSVDDTLGPIGRVEIITIPGTDIIILKGDPKDVARVRALITEIEKTSEDYQPQIEMFMLKHVDNAAVQVIIDEVYTTFYEPSLGDTAITALVKPNALLLVGPAEGVKQAKEIASKLDVPVDGATEFKVFRIKHMSAVDAENRLRAFYQGQAAQGGVGANAGGGQNAIGSSEFGGTGLALKLRLTSDYRSNTLFVHAKPADMATITKFIEELDVKSTEGNVDDVKVVRLKNSIAEDLAPILQDILTGQLQGAGQSTTGANGNQGLGQLQQQQGFSQIRSAMLALQAIDKDGELVQSNILFDTRITADANSNSLIIKAPKGSLKLIEMLIAQLDSLPEVESRIKIFDLDNASAVQVVETIQTLFEATQGGNQQGGGTSNIPIETGGYDSTIVSLKLAADARSNTVIAAGSKGDINIIEALVARLDQDIDSRYQHKVYRLQNVSATEVAEALTGWLEGRSTILAEDPSIVGSGDGSLESVKRQISVQAETETNSLIVTAHQDYIFLIEDMIRDIDNKKKIVLQAVIAEVTLNDAFEFGVEWGVQDSVLFDRGLGGTPGYPFNGLSSVLGNVTAANTLGLANREDVGAQGLVNLGVGRTGIGQTFGGLVLSAGNESINVLLRTLDTRTDVKVLSRPQITAMENIQAFIQVGQDVPYITGVDGDQVGTTTFGTDFLEIGVTLAVTPRVSPDGRIWMRVDVSNSSLSADTVTIGTTATGQTIDQNIVNDTTLQTDVTAMSGQTIILGGLITSRKSETYRGVPYFSNIPGLGRLFRFDADSEVRTELLVILRPVIVDSNEDESVLTQQETERMNWAIEDVVNMHGPVFENEMLAGETETVFPDRTPTGYHLEASKQPKANPVVGQDQIGNIAPLNGDSASSSRYNAIPLPNENRFGAAYRQQDNGQANQVQRTSFQPKPVEKKKKGIFPFKFK